MFRRSGLIASVIVPVLVGVLLLYVYVHRGRKALELGLGEGTSFHMPVKKSDPVLIMNFSEIDKLLKGWERRGKKDIILWLGNSQLNGINQYNPKQKNCTELLFDTLLNSSYEALGIAFPNGNLQEFLATLIYLHNKIEFKKVLLPVFYDDMREDRIRREITTTDFINTLRHDSSSASYYADLPDVNNALQLKEGAVEKNLDMKALDATAQEVVEQSLDSLAKKYWMIWNRRDDIRGNLFNDLYKFRNLVFGIKANTVRRMIAGKYDNNYLAYKQILRFCREKELQLFIYIPPLRNDVSPPYIMEEYDAFKNKVVVDASAANTPVLNLEDLVPAQYWGVKQSTSLGGDAEIDFMHFREEGHRLLADTIYQHIQALQ